MIYHYQPCHWHWELIRSMHKQSYSMIYHYQPCHWELIRSMHKHHTAWSTTTNLATDNWSDPCINIMLHDLPLPALPCAENWSDPCINIMLHDYHYQPCHWELIRSMHKHHATWSTTTSYAKCWELIRSIHTTSDSWRLQPFTNPKQVRFKTTGISC